MATAVAREYARTVVVSGVTAAVSLDQLARDVHRELIGTDLSTNEQELPWIADRVTARAPLLAEDVALGVAKRVSRLLSGLGEIEPLLADPSVTEVMINGPGAVWVERHGAVVRTEVTIDETHLGVLIGRIVGPLGLRADRTHPFVDARLPDGSRVNIAVPPLALDGPYVTIRRFRAEPHTLEEFCDGQVHARLVQAVEQRTNLVISGGTGSGKTSLLNALGQHVPPGERVITIEDAAELQLPGEHIVRLEARPPNAEGVGHVSIRALVRNALRMRPDRLVVGEVRGAEALDMVQAMNTGHAGSMSTCHANSPRDALARIEAMALMGDVDLPLQVIRAQAQSAIGLIIQVERQPGGHRRVQAVYECS